MRYASVVVVIALAMSACASESRVSARAVTHAGHVVVALGDSVPAGTACNCRPFPELAADELARVDHRPVATLNDAVPGARSSDVLDSLKSNASVMSDVSHADAVLIEVGANDLGYSAHCGTVAACYETNVPRVANNIAALVARVRTLTANPRASVVLLDYWNAWLGGKYAQARGNAYVDASTLVTRELNETIRSVAARSGATYVDLRHAFRGPNEDQDETHLLASDGDHPNAAGHAVIAGALEAATFDFGSAPAAA